MITQAWKSTCYTSLSYTFFVPFSVFLMFFDTLARGGSLGRKQIIRWSLCMDIVYSMEYTHMKAIKCQKVKSFFDIQVLKFSHSLRLRKWQIALIRDYLCCLVRTFELKHFYSMRVRFPSKLFLLYEIMI